MVNTRAHKIIQRGLGIPKYTIRNNEYTAYVISTECVSASISDTSDVLREVAIYSTSVLRD